MPKFVNRVSTFALALCLCVPAIATAQNAEDGATPDLTSDGLSLGQPASEVRKPGDTYVKETFGDWSLRCVVVAQGDEPCQMYQLLSDGSGAAIAEITLFQLPEGGQASAGATIIVPLETSLANQLSIQVDDRSRQLYPFAFCNTVGCYSRIGLTADDVAAYKRGAAAELSIVPMAAPDQVVTVRLSLDGFTAAFDASSVLQR